MKTDLNEQVTSKALTTLIDGVMPGPIRTINSLWSIAFGGIDSFATKLELKRTQALNEYKDSLIDKIENVPTEKLIEPKISLIGPALEASKYYIEEKELREMFANLVANSINSEKTNFVHHAFVEIIKQLSPLDANNLELFDGFSTLPIVQIQYVTPGGSLMLNDNVFLGSDTTLTNVDENSTSITNLSRLGLVNIDYSNH